MINRFLKVFLPLICIASSSFMRGQESDVLPEYFQEKFKRSVAFYRSIMQHHDSSVVIDTVLCRFDIYFERDTTGKIALNDFKDLEKNIKILEAWELEWLQTANLVKLEDLDTAGGIYSCTCNAYDAAGSRISRLSPRGGLPKPQDQRKENSYYSYAYLLDFYGKGYFYLVHSGTRSLTLNQFWKAVWAPSLGLRWFKDKNMKVDTFFTTQEAMRYKSGQYKFILSERSVGEE